MKTPSSEAGKLSSLVTHSADQLNNGSHSSDRLHRQLCHENNEKTPATANHLVRNLVAEDNFGKFNSRCVF